MQKVSVQSHGFGFGLWLIGWMFTIGFLHFGFWDGVVAFFIWPYHLGVYFASIGL